MVDCTRSTGPTDHDMEDAMHTDLAITSAPIPSVWPSGGKDDELDLRNHLCLALYTANNGFVRAYENRMKEMGWTYPQLICMFTLWESSPRTVTRIARALNLGKATITPILKRLEDRGLIQRTRDDADERKVNIHVTDKGRAMKEPVRALRAQLGCDMAVTSDYIESLKAQLNDLQGRLAQAEDQLT